MSDNQMPSPAGAKAPVQAVGESQPVVNVPSPEKKPPEVKAPRGVQVRALRDGWSGNRRRKSGDVFFVPSLDKVGTWAECTDPKSQKEVVALREKRKQELAGKKSAQP